MQKIKTNFNIQIRGNRNVVITDHLLAFIGKCDNLQDLLEEIKSYRNRLRKEKSKIINNIFLLSAPLIFFLMFVAAALTANSIKFTIFFMILTAIPAIFISNQFKKLDELSPEIKSAEGLLIEIYKLIILDKIKKDKQPNTND